MNVENNRKKLSVIMPALNEEKNILDAVSNTLKAFELLNINGELIVINDGSTDRTQKLVEQKTKEFPGRIYIIQHAQPKGIGSCFWEGINYSKGDVIVMLPGDNENDPQEILRYHKLLEHVDIAVPFIFNKESRTLFRNILSFIYRFIINTTFLVNFNYTNGTILYRKSVLKELHGCSSGFFFQTDILVRSVKKGYLFAEVPYRLALRKTGASKAITFPSFYQVIKGYLKLVMDYYFKKDKNERENFSSDSLTAIRRKNSTVDTDNN